MAMRNYQKIPWIRRVRMILSKERFNGTVLP